jgi:SAM-dependent methyltransferase
MSHSEGHPSTQAPAADRFSIKAGYVPNTQALTVDASDQTRYWTPARIAASKRDFYQFDVYRYAVKLVERHGIRSIMDVGCGTGMKLGYVHEKVPDVRIIGIDQQSAIEFCRTEHAFGEWYVDDFENPSADLDVRADLVVCADVIEHLLDPDRLLEYLKGKVAPGGLILISTPERDRLRGPECTTSPNPFHVREWSYDEFASYLRGAGFEVLEHMIQFPLRLRFNRLVFREVVLRYLKGRSGKFNQVCLLRVP